MAILIAYEIMGWPAKSLTFLRGILLLPPLAGMIAIFPI